LYGAFRIQVPDLPLRPYKNAEKRTQQVMRVKTIDLLADSANKFVHFKNEDIPHFISDLVLSGKWKGTFGEVCQTKPDTDDYSYINLQLIITVAKTELKTKLFV